MTDDLYARARILVVESLIGYDEDDKPGALFSVVGEMMLEAMDLGLGAHDLAEELRALAVRVDSAEKEYIAAAEDAAKTEAWLYGEDPFGVDQPPDSEE